MMKIFLLALVMLSFMLDYSKAEANNATSEIHLKENETFLDIIKSIFSKISPGLDYLGDLPTHAATSCQQIAKLRPNIPSGFYWIQVGDSPSRIFCDMNMTQCGGGVWTRIANVNMTIPSTKCPSGLERVTSPRRSCRKTVNRGMSRTTFSTFGLPYNKVCGYVTAYQCGTPDAFHPFVSQRSIESCYVDGVLISYNHPREHIWSFVASPTGDHKNAWNGCPCSISGQGCVCSVPSFIGQDYFCETGFHQGSPHPSTCYTLHTLWDGKGIGTFPNGCQGTRKPWFKKSFPYMINSNVELRICLDQDRNDEDILVEQIHMFVQ